MPRCSSGCIVWFILPGLGLSPVMVGATEVIVGNAPVELAGVASGLQSTAMQLGGTLGTAILGAVISARISTLLPAGWTAAHLPALNPAQLAGVKSAVSVGMAPVAPGTPPRAASLISHNTFVSGMHTAFLVAAAVALAGAGIALLTSRGNADQPGQRRSRRLTACRRPPATWNLFLGLLMLSYGYWPGVVPPTGAALLFYAGCHLLPSTHVQRAA